MVIASASRARTSSVVLALLGGSAFGGSACLAGDASYAEEGFGGAPSTTSDASSSGSAATSGAGGDPMTSSPASGGGGTAGASSSETSTGSGGSGGSAGDGGSAGGGGGGGGGGGLAHTYLFGGTEGEEIFDARISPGGAVYVTGAFHGNASLFGARVVGGDCHGTRRGFILRLDHDLQPDWVRCFGADTSEIVSLAFDGADHAFALGQFMGDLAVAGESFSRGVVTTFVVSLDASGADQWVEVYPAPAATRAGTIVRTPDALFITGSFRGAITLGDARLVSGSQYDGFLARVSTADGSVAWALQQVEGAASVHLFAAASPTGASPLLLAGELKRGLTLVDPSGSVRTVSDLDGTDRDVFTAEIDADDGSVVGLIKRIGGPGDDHITGLDVGDAVAVVSGTFHTTIDPDGVGGPLEGCTAAEADADAFLVRLDAADQRPLSVLCVGGAGDQTPRAVAISRDGLLCSMGGDFTSEIDWGAGSATTSFDATADAFVIEANDKLEVSLGDAFGGGTGVRSVRGVDATNSGRFLYAGTFTDKVFLPDGMHESAGGTDGFVVLYDALP